GIRMPLREAEQILGPSPREGVDRLARIADDTDVVAIAQPEFEQALLRGRDVLILVDDEEPVLRAHLLRDARFTLDHARAGEQHVFEVELTALVLQALVRTVQVDGGTR